MLLTLASSTNAAPPESNIIKLPGLSFTPPKSFTRTNPEHPAALVLLRPQATDFPTFNVVVEPGKLVWETTALAAAEQITTAYRKVGFNQVQLEKADFQTIVDQQGLNVQLNYRSGAQKLTARVIILNGTDRHYYLTFVDRSSHFQEHQPLLQSLLASVRLTRLIDEPATQNTPKPRSPIVLTLLIIAALIIVVGLIILYQHRAHT